MKKGITTITSMTFLVLAVVIMVSGLVAWTASLQEQTGVQSTGSADNTTAELQRQMQSYKENLSSTVEQLQPPSSEASGFLMIVTNAWNALVFIFKSFPGLLYTLVSMTAAWLHVPTFITGVMFLAIGLYLAYAVLRVVFKIEV